MDSVRTSTGWASSGHVNEIPVCGIPTNILSVTKCGMHLPSSVRVCLEFNAASTYSSSSLYIARPAWAVSLVSPQGREWT